MTHWGKTDHHPSRLNRCCHLPHLTLTSFVFLRAIGCLGLMGLGRTDFELLSKMLFFVSLILGESSQKNEILGALLYY